MNGERKFDGIRTQFRGSVPHDGEWGVIDQEVTIIGRGVITGQTDDKEGNNLFRSLKVRMTSAEIALVPLPPQLFDDLEQGLSQDRPVDQPDESEPEPE